MWGVTRFLEKVYIFEEGGSGYCSKKKDDICNEVIFFFSLMFFLCVCL